MYYIIRIKEVIVNDNKLTVDVGGIPQEYTKINYLNIEALDPPTFDKGDLNADGNVDLTDAIIALKVLTELDTEGLIPANYAELGVDADENQTISLAEAIYVLKSVAGLK